MTFSNFDELKAEILDYSERPDQADKVEGFIKLAEARLNRELAIVANDQAPPGELGSRLALSAQQPTNWLLTKHPDVYLAACLAWGAAYSEAFVVAASWQQLLESSLDEVATEIRRAKRTTLKLDKGLLRAGGG